MFLCTLVLSHLVSANYHSTSCFHLINVPFICSSAVWQTKGKLSGWATLVNSLYYLVYWKKKSQSKKRNKFLVSGTMTAFPLLHFKGSSYNRHAFATIYILQLFVFKNDIIEQEVEINGLDRMKFIFILWLKTKVKQSFLLELKAKCYLFLAEITSSMK